MMELDKPYVTSQEIASVASKSKKKFNPKREKQLVEKSKTSKCKCHHLKLVGLMCMYRTCRHVYEKHNKGDLVE